MVVWFVIFDIWDVNSGGVSIYNGSFDYDHALFSRFILYTVCILVLLVSYTTLLGDHSRAYGNIHTPYLEETVNCLSDIDSTKELTTPKAVPNTLAVFDDLLNFIIIFVQKSRAEWECECRCHINNHKQCAEAIRAHVIYCGGGSR